MTFTYLVAAVLSFVLFLITNKEHNIAAEFGKLNWTSYILGIVIVGLEAGTLYAYKAGWQISTESIVQNCFLAVALLLVGYLLYKEPITANKLAGMLICLFGLYLINKK